MLLRLVDGEADVAGRDLAQDAAGRAAVDRVKVVPVLDLGNVGVADALEVGLHHGLFLLGRYLESDVVGNALGEGP